MTFLYKFISARNTVFFVIGLLILPIFYNTKVIKSFVYGWQELVGALIGSAVPISLYLLSEIGQERRRRKRHFELLEKSLVTAINNLSEIDNLLNDFLDGVFSQYKLNVVEDDKEGRSSVGQMFIPLTYVFTLDRELLKESTDSSYLENSISDVIKNSHDLQILLSDMQRQLESTLALNTQLGFSRINTASINNKTLLFNLTGFETMTRNVILGKNIPLYLRKLILTRTALQFRMKVGLKEWRKLFNYKAPFTSETAAKMTAHFKEDANKQLTEVQKMFKSKVLFVE